MNNNSISTEMSDSVGSEEKQFQLLRAYNIMGSTTHLVFFMLMYMCCALFFTSDWWVHVFTHDCQVLSFAVCGRISHICVCVSVLLFFLHQCFHVCIVCVSFVFCVFMFDLGIGCASSIQESNLFPAIGKHFHSSKIKLRCVLYI